MVYSQGVPIGTIAFYPLGMSGLPELGPEWKICNGQVVNDSKSPYHGKTLPNINGRFLRGNTSSGGTGGSDTHTHNIPTTQLQRTNNNGLHGGTSSSADHLPMYHELVAIMRVR